MSDLKDFTIEYYAIGVMKCNCPLCGTEVHDCYPGGLIKSENGLEDYQGTAWFICLGCGWNATEWDDRHRVLFAGAPGYDEQGNILFP